MSNPAGSIIAIVAVIAVIFLFCIGGVGMALLLFLGSSDIRHQAQPLATPGSIIVDSPDWEESSNIEIND